MVGRGVGGKNGQREILMARAAGVITRFSAAAVLALALAFPSCAEAEQAGMALDGDAQREMSLFVSNFAELDMLEIANRNYMKYGDFVYFGAMHSYMNSPETVKRGRDGRVSVDFSAARRAVKKYFGTDIGMDGELVSAVYGGKKFERTAGSFVFAEPEARTVYHARVREAYEEDGMILMKGELYERGNPGNSGGPFYVWAEPHGNGGREAWLLVSIHRGEHDGSPFGAGMLPPGGD
ncbi:MAG: hypothetical protein LBU26_05675 [Synergistaceae bacterium]|jgi:hypothetical protein|nr:hypothetical protein [Synergistaceae bacterium]